MLRKYFNLIPLFFIVITIIIFLVNAKGCVNRGKNNTKSGSSSVSTFMINAPSNLTATVISYSQVSLSWLDNSNNEDGFEIKRSLNGITYTLLSTLNADTTSYSDTGLSPFTTYYYRIRAFNTIGDRSDWSSEVNVTTNILETWSKVATGEFHSVALTTNGLIWGWGNNNSGQLGLGNDAPLTVTIPTQLGDATDWVNIVAGYYHTLALKNNGTLWSWGANESGQLGLGDTDLDRYEPVQLNNDTDWSMVAGGANHTIALKTNGGIWSWGYNSFGQLGLGYSGDPDDLGNPFNYVTIPTQIGIDSDWSLIASGSAHSFAIKNNGTLWSWGSNVFMQLGLEDSDNRTTPSLVNTSSDWAKVNSAYSHTVTIKTNGTIWYWGGYAFSPTQLGEDIDWLNVDAGGVIDDPSYTIGMKTNATLWAWGYNIYGQLGLGDFNQRSAPAQIGTTSDWVTFIAGGYHNIGLTTGNILYVWGLNDYNQLGLGDTINRNIPCPLGSPAPPLLLVANMISSSEFSLSWIDNANNEIGFIIERKSDRNGTYEQIATLDANITSYTDISVSGFASAVYYYYRIKSYNGFGESSYSNEAFTAISGRWVNPNAGMSYSLSLKTDGTLWTWGDNGYGQLGDGSNMTRTTPRQIGILFDWTDNISVGDAHTIALKNNGTLWAWGKNDYGQLGDGTTNNRKTPRQVYGNNTDWSKIEAGSNHNLAIKTNKTLWAWGYNGWCQLGDNTSENRLTPRQITISSDWSMLTAGDNYSLALKSNGTLWGWGNNTLSQLGNGDTNPPLYKTSPTQSSNDTDWSMISAGHAHVIARKINNTLWGWGNNTAGQIGDGTTNQCLTPKQISIETDWTVILADGNHTLAINNNGTLWAWGDNSYGQLGLGDTENRLTPNQIGIESTWSMLGARQLHSIALKTNRTLWIWGNNDYGQLGLGDRSYVDDTDPENLVYISRNRYTPTLVGE